MKTIHTAAFFVLFLFFGVAYSLPAETAYAAHSYWGGYNGDIWERINQRLEDTQSRLEKRQEDIQKRVEEVHARLEMRQQHLCDLFRGLPFPTLPSYCMDDGGGDEEPEAPTLALSADPDSITEGATSTLSWDSEFANTCEASNGWSGAKALDGSEIVAPVATTTYTLTCVGEGGTTTESVIVGVSSEPEPEPEPEVPTLSFTADPDSIEEGATSTLAWDSEFADTCEASDGWAGAKALDGSEDVMPTATTTYTLTCVGEGGTTTESVVVNVSPLPEPEPQEDIILISEVLYDLANDASQGTEVGGDNEWVELYNAGSTTVDLDGWMIGESTSTADMLASSELLLAPGEYLVVTDATTTALFWDFSGATVIYLDSPITSSGLANGGDYIALFTGGGVLADDVSYGSNTTAFDPSVGGVTDGHSIARDPVGEDTDSAADWVDSDTPIPGS